MKLFKRKFLFAFFYGILLITFTIYVILDTFVIQKVYIIADSTVNNKTNEMSTNLKSSEDNSKSKVKKNSTSNTIESTISITENTYKDENIEVTISQYAKYDTEIYVADVVLSSAEYLKTAFAKNSYGKNVTEKTSTIASNQNAILAINGDYYGVQEKGYVLKNGVIYRETSSSNQEDLVIYGDGSFEIINENEVSLTTLLNNGAYNVLSFGPSLIINSEINVSENDEVGKAKASNPRTAIGIIDKLHYVFVVSDGRTSESEGLSLYELAEFMQGLGVKTAYNLDGGGSSTMYFNGTVINNPTSDGKSIKERSVSDIVYIGY